VVRDI